ncbi:type II toxin-antitoxin system CcdA family antitoxin [Pseudorhodoferax soli]|uniref:Antitoxin CcdA n=1 Tax=Pseudorhodoferax soli TaxID=545864 RepID=A0A368X977_9BURK|nr:type II toxin-antitoxin system CcdA family antitoxin [Pseudorhodoferax soli]RCW64513.1 antitoxin CcdA [Pseudorhodoferax soli]
MRIKDADMTDLAERRKRAINLSLNEALVDEARRYSPNLSATVEALLTEYVHRESAAQAERRQRADACTAGWNEVHARIGSLADEHTTL